MTYALTIAVKLLPVDTGLSAVLYARIYNNATPRVEQAGSPTAAGAGWTEIANGEYIFSYSSFANNLVGSIDFWQDDIVDVFHTSTAFQPPDANVISVNEVTTAADNIQAIYDGVSAGAPAKFTTLITTGTTTLDALTVTNATTLSGAVSLGNNLSVTGTTTFTDTVSIPKQLSIGGATSPAAGAFYITNASGPGMYVTTTNATSSAIEALGNTTGSGIKLTGGASSGKGMHIVGGSTDGHGLYVEGTGTGYDFVLKNDRFRDAVGGYIDVTAAAITGTVDVVSISGSTSAADNLELMTKDGPSAGAALHLTTLDATGAVLFGSTFDVTGTTTLSTFGVGATTLNALTVSNATTLNTLSASGDVSFGTVFNIGGIAIESLVSDQVWDELIAGHAIVGSTGAALSIASGLASGVNVTKIAGDTAAATNLKNALQGDSQNVATKGTDLDNLKTVKDTITGQISTKTIMSIDQLKNVLGV